MKTETLIHELSRQGRPITRVERPLVAFLRWSLVAALCVGVGSAAFGVRPDVGLAVRDPTFLALAIVTLALGACSALSAFVLSVPDRARLWLDAVPVALLALWLAVLAHAFYRADGAHAGFGVACVGRILALAALPSASLYVMLRRAAPLDGRRVGALAALGAVALGALGTQFVCRDGDPLHILIWHYVPVVIAGGAGVVAGRLLLGWDGE